MASKFEQRLEELKRKYSGGGGTPDKVPAPSTSSTPAPSQGGVGDIQAKMLKRLGITAPAAPAQTPVPDVPKVEPVKIPTEQRFDESPNLVADMPDLPKYSSPQYLSEKTAQAAKAITPSTVSEFKQYQKAQEMKLADRYRLAVDIGKGKVKVTELAPDQIPWDQLFSQPMYGQIAAVGMKDPAKAYPLLVEMQGKLTGSAQDKQSILPPSFGAGFAEGAAESASLGVSQMAPGRTTSEKAGQFVGQVAGALPGVIAAAGTGGTALGGLATRVAPQLGKTLAGRALTTALAGAGTGAVYQTAREGAQAVARPEEADLKRSLENVASTTGTYALFGALSPVSSEILGSAGRLIANKVPGGQAMAQSVATAAKQYPTVAKGVEGATEGLLTGGMYGTVMGGVDAVRDPEARSMKAFVQSAAQNAGEEFGENIIEALVLGLAQKWVPVNAKAVVDAGKQIQQAEQTSSPKRDVLAEGLALANELVPSQTMPTASHAPVQQEQVPSPTPAVQTPPVASQTQVEAPKPESMSKVQRRSLLLRDANPGMDEKSILRLVKDTSNLSDADFATFAQRVGKPESTPPQQTQQAQSDTQVLVSALRQNRQRGENQYRMDVTNAMDPEPYRGFDEAMTALPDEVARNFQVHGVAAGDQDANIVNLLTNGIDSNRTFHSGPPKGGMVDGATNTRTRAPYLLISDAGKTLRETGVKNVVVNDAVSANLAVLRRAFPDVRFMTPAEAASFMQGASSAPAPTPNANSVEASPEPEEGVIFPQKPLPSKPKTFGETVQVGDRVTVEGRKGIFEVVDTKDPSLLRVKTVSGAELPVGRATVKPVEVVTTPAQTEALKAEVPSVEPKSESPLSDRLTTERVKAELERLKAIESKTDADWKQIGLYSHRLKGVKASVVQASGQYRITFSGPISPSLSRPLGTAGFKYNGETKEWVAATPNLASITIAEEIQGAMGGGEVAKPRTVAAPEKTSATPKSEPAIPVDDKSGRIAESLRKVAYNMQNSIDQKRNPAISNQNVTARRARIADSMAKDADRLERIQNILRSLADAHENGKITESIKDVRTRSMVEMILQWETIPRADGWAQDERKKLLDAFGSAPKYQQARRDLFDLLDKGPKESAEEQAEKKRKAEIAALERELLGTKIEGYFPTPKAVAERMLESADIEDGMTVLEPSAGKGNIADMVRGKMAGVELEVIEVVPRLRKILEAKGYKLAGSDFLEHNGQYDRVVMNPPFEKYQDVEHVKHAYDLLKPGGKLVSIMSEGPFFRSDKRGEAFREWLDNVEGTSEKLPDGAFMSSERPTGVATRMVVIEKPTTQQKGEENTGTPAKVEQKPAELPAIAKQTPSQPTQVTPSALPPMTDNYRKPLSTYTKTLYRETDITNALPYIPGSNTTDSAVSGEVFFANTPDLALGQGGNTGVMLEFDSVNVKGSVNARKPGWKIAYESGQAEFIGNHNDAATMQGALRSVTVKPTAQSNKGHKRRLETVLSALEKQGWSKTENADGSVTYRRDGTSPLSQPVQQIEQMLATSTVKPPEQASGEALVAMSKELTRLGVSPQVNVALMDAFAQVGKYDFDAVYDAAVKVYPGNKSAIAKALNAVDGDSAARTAADTYAKAHAEWKASLSGQTEPQTPATVEPAPSEQQPSQKEPLQMTRAEFDERWTEQNRRGLEEEVAKKVEVAQSEVGRLNSIIASNPDNPANVTLRANVAQLQGEITKQRERLNTPIAAPSTFMSESQLRHYRGVDEAVKAGEKLPPEVLADYPDLQTNETTATQQRSTPTKTEESKRATSQTGLTEAGGKMADGLTESTYDMLWQKAQKGDTTELGAPSAILQVAKVVRDAGGVRTREEFVSLAKDAQNVRNSGVTGKEYQAGLRAVVAKYIPKQKPTSVQEQSPTVSARLRSKVDAQEGTGVTDTRMGILPDALRGTVKLGQPVKQTADVPMENAEAEERFQNAKNRPPGESPLQQVKTWWGTVKQHLTSDLPYLPGGQRYAKLAFKLRQLSKGRGTASDRAVLYLQGITTNLKRDEYNLFSRAVVYADMLEDVNRGLYDTDAELAFGLTPDELRREHARVKAAVEQNEQVKQSLADRKAVMQEVRTTYADMYEKVNGKPLPWNREDYFHHEVLNRLGVTTARVNGTGQTVQTQKAGWMKARKGTSYDFLTNYLEAEHKVIAEMLYGIKVHQLIDFVNQTENKTSELKAEAKRLSEETGQKVKWKSLIPEGYRLWQPDPGNFMFRATALDARVVDEIMNSDLEEATATIDDIRSVLVIGGKKMEFVIPTEVADTLDHFSRSKPPGVYDALDGAVRKVMTAWKKHQLLFLTRAFKYNVRNLTGDVDALVSANPGALKKIGRAVAELHNFLIRGGAPTAELEAWMDRGGMQDVLGIAEGVTQVDALKQFRRVSEQPSVKQMLESGDVAGVAKRFSSKYAWVAKYTNLREYTLRYAAFLDYVDQIQKNGKPDNWGASVREEVQALEDPYDMAYELSNDLLGAYDKVSVAGQWVRERFIPFWSWNEVNVRRYKHLIENAVRDGLTVEKVGKATASKLARIVVKSPLIAYNLGKFALKAHALTAMLAAWNYLLFREEEESLPESVRAKPHIIFGRDEDGKVQYFNRLGAIADFYEWFGLDGSTRYVKDYLNGRMTLKEIATDMAMSPVNKLAQGFGPSKTAVEVLLGKTMYPDVSKPRTIRDKWEFLADSVAVGDVYRLAFGKPTRGAGEIVRNMFTYRIDPQEVAYSEMVGAKYEWLKKKKGMGDPGGPISPKSNALYYFKQALRYGDEEAANKYLRQYVEYGGTSKGLNQSLKALHPLYGMSKDEAATFIGQLSEKEKDQLRTAIEFYGKVLSGDVGN